MRTTLDIDEPILADLRKLGRRRRKSMGRLVSDLLATAIRNETTSPVPDHGFTWVDKPMGAKIDLADRDALYDAMDRKDEPA